MKQIENDVTLWNISLVCLKVSINSLGAVVADPVGFEGPLLLKEVFELEMTRLEDPPHRVVDRIEVELLVRQMRLDLSVSPGQVVVDHLIFQK